MVALDTNLLVYAFNPGKPEHLPARRVVDGLTAEGERWGFTLASVIEFWNLTTRTAGGPMGTPEKAAAFLSELIHAGARLWQPLEGFGEHLVARAVVEGVIGRRIFDWQIGLTALQNGATELWTHDRTFRAPEGLRVVDPLD